MMGAHHAISGSAAWVAVAGAGPLTLGLYPVSDSGLLIGAIVCAGAALLPDADHHNGTIAHSLPPLSTLVTRAVARVSGGHRNGTHGLLAIPFAVTVAVAAGLVNVETEAFGQVALGAGLLSLLLVAYAAKALRVTNDGSWLRSWGVALVVSAMVTLFAPQEWEWLPFAVGLGVTVHIAGDMLTTGGVPLLWPLRLRPPRWWRRTPVLNDVWLPSGRVALPILGDTGSIREWALAIPLTAYTAYGCLAAIAGLLQA